MKGNRPNDVCALCDRAIDLTLFGHGALHRYVGRDWVHGGGKEHIATHMACPTAFAYTEGSPAYESIHNYLKTHIMI